MGLAGAALAAAMAWVEGAMGAAVRAVVKAAKAAEEEVVAAAARGAAAAAAIGALAEKKAV